MLEVLVEVELDGERGEYGVVDEGTSQIRQGARAVTPRVFVEVPRDQVVCSKDKTRI